MRWTPGQQSGDIEDRRNQGGGGGGGMKLGLGGLLVLGVLSLIFQRDLISPFRFTTSLLRPRRNRPTRCRCRSGTRW